jgi:protein-tyrosine phosphatase
MRAKHLALTTTVLVLLTWAAAAVADGVPIRRFAQVSQGIARGGRPERIGLEAVARMGFKTDLDLEDDRGAVEREAQSARELGLHMISMPMSGFWVPNDAEVGQIISILADPNNYPIFVHCQHGEDRTGLIVGLYRVFVEHWSRQDAYEEMRAHGFHRSLIALDHYFKEKTRHHEAY